MIPPTMSNLPAFATTVGQELHFSWAESSEQKQITPTKKDFTNSNKRPIYPPSAPNRRSQRLSECAEECSPNKSKNLQETQILTKDSSSVRLGNLQYQFKQEEQKQPLQQQFGQKEHQIQQQFLQVEDLQQQRNFRKTDQRQHSRTTGNLHTKSAPLESHKGI